MAMGDYGKAFGQLGDGRFCKPLFFSLGLATLTAGCLLPAGYFGFQTLVEPLSEWAEAGDSWWGTALEWTLPFLGLVLAAGVGFLLFGLIQTAWLGLFLDGIIEATCEKHYPDFQPAPPPTLLRSCWVATRFLLVSLTVNMVILPLVIIGWFLPPTGLIIQVLTNGYLVEREYRELVAERLKGISRGKMAGRWFWGTLTAGMFLVPVLNFATPVLAASAMTHKLRRLAD